MEGVVRRKPPEEGESYFMSMTDMMVGLLLIFIILLAYFALNLQTKTEELTGANRTRAEILNDLQQSLKDRGLQVEIDTKTGVLRLPDDVLFDKGQWELTERGQAAISKVASAMVEVLPCYTTSDLCEGSGASILSMQCSSRGTQTPMSCRAVWIITAFPSEGRRRRLSRSNVVSLRSTGFSINLPAKTAQHRSSV